MRTRQTICPEEAKKAKLYTNYMEISAHCTFSKILPRKTSKTFNFFFEVARWKEEEI